MHENGATQYDCGKGLTFHSSCDTGQDVCRLGTVSLKSTRLDFFRDCGFRGDGPSVYPCLHTLNHVFMIYDSRYNVHHPTHELQSVSCFMHGLYCQSPDPLLPHLTTFVLSYCSAKSADGNPTRFVCVCRISRRWPCPASRYFFVRSNVQTLFTRPHSRDRELPLESVFGCLAGIFRRSPW